MSYRMVIYVLFPSAVVSFVGVSDGCDAQRPEHLALYRVGRSLH
ncbi:hypothetical protein BLAT2472_170023 [Burkholderia latens]